MGAEGGSREPRARKAERSAGTRRSGARGSAGAGGQVCGRPQLRRLQAGPASGAGSRAGDSTPEAQSRPRPCSAWERGAGTTARQGYPKPSVGPGWAGVGGGPPGPPMGSGCRCGGATSRRRTPSWTPSSASLRARVSGGGAGGPGTGRGASSSECEWGERGVPGGVHLPSASQRG